MTRQSPSALITGASAGIGQGYSEHLARTGHDLVLVARREDRLNELASRLRDAHGIAVEVLVADLSSEEGAGRVADRIVSGPLIDLLINNAGYASRGRVSELAPDTLDQMLRVNILALSRLSIAAMGRMAANGRGSIINVGSGTAFMQFPGNAGYGASKNYVMAFTRHMHLEAEGTGVRIQLLVPGVVSTDFHQIAGADLANFPPERVMKPDDLVVASLRALEKEESVCIPSLPNIKDWEAYVKAETTVGAQTSRDRIAARYH
ncbi:short-subunit dehydrogenase [Phyllobacterium sp. 1468]|uniref:SDR family NAD(P)-dependent oxidoreductase n=1 Tax=Phyllobacterium sp. 1468 TaxID=2817759 RepID=UPI002859BF01|nr:SDR family oxidoreductase [Phyllobacterium sp. 1468]MDR6632607.1 short-subunit dehydrogenase [Phyllobacterium sp. 1468]